MQFKIFHTDIKLYNTNTHLHSELIFLTICSSWHHFKSCRSTLWRSSSRSLAWGRAPEHWRGLEAVPPGHQHDGKVHAGLLPLSRELSYSALLGRGLFGLGLLFKPVADELFWVWITNLSNISFYSSLQLTALYTSHEYKSHFTSTSNCGSSSNYENLSPLSGLLLGFGSA